MPCRGPDPPTETDRYAQNTCYLAEMLSEELGTECPDWILEGARREWRKRGVSDRATAHLCAMCRAIPPSSAVWGIDTRWMLELRIWWKDHQELDARRECKEEAARYNRRGKKPDRRSKQTEEWWK